MPAHRRTCYFLCVEAGVFLCRAGPLSAVAAGRLGIHFRVRGNEWSEREDCENRLWPVFVLGVGTLSLPILGSGLRPAQKALPGLLSNL